MVKMKKFVYKRRADGLAVINTILIDEKLRESIDLLLKYGFITDDEYNAVFNPEEYGLE